jgi:hypothetical protein
MSPSPGAAAQGAAAGARSGRAGRIVRDANEHRMREDAPKNPVLAGQPIAVITELCQCTSAALVKLLTPDEIARNFQPGVALSDEQVQRAVDQCPNAVRRAPSRRLVRPAVRLEETPNLRGAG